MTATEQPPAPAAGARPEPAREPRRGQRVLAGVAGLLAAAVGLGVAELAAGFIGPDSSPVVAVGDKAITLTPEPVKNFAIRTFGTGDKQALIVGTLIVTAVYAVAVGLVALRRRGLGELGVVLFGVLGILAAVTRPAGRPVDAVPSAVAAVVGVLALRLLVARLAPEPDAPLAAAPSGLDRRRFLVAGGVAVGVAVVAGGGGRLLERRFAVAGERARLVLPTPASPAPPLPPGADLAPTTPGLTPLFTRNADFYRVDTALTVPQIDPAQWRLTLSGMFDRPRTYRLSDLFGRRDLIERDITLTCVSNDVGGDLAGTARWLGVPLGTFLRENGVRSTSSQLVCRSSDGMTIGASTRAALETPDAMLAFGMNGQPLPVEHGFPVRMIIPGLYGYVSACKWLTRIEASTFEGYDAYWVQRGWAQQGEIKTESRIDTPAPLRPFRAGRRAIAGVAWAQTRGISKVEVKVDDGPWTPARLAPADDREIWRQWVLPYDFRPGSHLITVRATDGQGTLQAEQRAEPYPSGATGWHSIRVLTS